MPQLIAMIIVVVGAMIYMFQTFGGTGDKIEGIAQKTSILTEINNIKNGLKLAARNEVIVVNSRAAAVNGLARNLEGLGELNYFAQQINEQLDRDTAAFADTITQYNAISFGGTQAVEGDMTIEMVNDRIDRIPGIFITLQGALADNAGFLEAQIAADLEAVAHIDRHATAAATGGAGTLNGATTGIDARIPVDTAVSANSLNDGRFIVYFRDFGTSEVVLNP